MVATHADILTQVGGHLCGHLGVAVLEVHKGTKANGREIDESIYPSVRSIICVRTMSWHTLSSRHFAGVSRAFGVRSEDSAVRHNAERRARSVGTKLLGDLTAGLPGARLEDLW